MSRLRPWGEHSSRWVRRQTRLGWTRERWNAWRRLPHSTRVTLVPTAYARGQGVRQQARDDTQVRAVALKLARLKHGPHPKGPKIEELEQIVRDVMTPRERYWTLKASATQIRIRARRVPEHVWHGVPWNPYWY